MQNKPNSPNVQMNVTFFITMIYTIFISLTGVKNKPNQSQYKANTKPIASKAKIDAKYSYTKDYENISRSLLRKNKPKQTQFQNQNM